VLCIYYLNQTKKIGSFLSAFSQLPEKIVYDVYLKIEP